jgi:hypothetical protein
VDEKVGAIDKFGVSQVLPGDLSLTGGQHARVRFVVTGIYHGYPVGLQAIPKRKRWMIIAGGRDIKISKVPRQGRDSESSPRTDRA